MFRKRCVVGAWLTHGYHRDREPRLGRGSRRPRNVRGGDGGLFRKCCVGAHPRRRCGASTTSTTLSSWIFLRSARPRAARGIAIATDPRSAAIIADGGLAFSAQDSPLQAHPLFRCGQAGKRSPGNGRRGLSHAAPPRRVMNCLRLIWIAISSVPVRSRPFRKEYHAHIGGL